jgi:hypothetical protein
MKPNLLMSIILPLLASCLQNDKKTLMFSPTKDAANFPNSGTEKYNTIESIPLPDGYKRINFATNSFATWLRKVQLKQDDRVFLFNGQLKPNQSAQYAVIDIPVGKKDLQQCADAIMRMRAQYLFDQKKFHEISFSDNSGKRYTYSIASTSFESYLEKVFTNCGTLSLEKELKKVTDFQNLEPGNVFIKGGSPGHAVIVVDIASNLQGRKIYLLAQSYMPAQDIHILKNPMNSSLSPWYQLTDNSLIYTPEWTFKTGQLKKW